MAHKQSSNISIDSNIVDNKLDGRTTRSDDSLESLSPFHLDQAEEFNENSSESGIGTQGSLVGQLSKDFSMDLSDFLRGMEDERDSRNNNANDDDSISVPHYSKDSDSDDLSDTSKTCNMSSMLLQLEDLPSSRELGWRSFNWGSFVGSFRKRMGSKKLFRGGDSRKKQERRKEGQRKKVVRFCKQEIVYPGY